MWSVPDNWLGSMLQYLSIFSSLRVSAMVVDHECVDDSDDYSHAVFCQGMLSGPPQGLL